MQDLFGIFKYGYANQYQHIKTLVFGPDKNPSYKGISRLSIPGVIKVSIF
jgi:hypothetical protein